MVIGSLQAVLYLEDCPASDYRETVRRIMSDCRLQCEPRI